MNKVKNTCSTNIYKLLLSTAIGGAICCLAWGISDANLPTVDVEVPSLYDILKPDLLNFNTYDNFKVIEDSIPVITLFPTLTDIVRPDIFNFKFKKAGIIPLPRHRPKSIKKYENCFFTYFRKNDGSCELF